MSLPPPWTVHVLPDRDWPPAGAGAPMSLQLHPLGHVNPGGGNSPDVLATVSIVTVSPVPWLWEVMANPAKICPVMAMATVDPATAVQLFPSGDVYAV